ncbi:MAG: phage tail protein I, partial [Enterovibrio sp.]
KVKRQVVNDAFEVHKHKGTPHAVQCALNSLGIKTNIVEWWEQGGSQTPGTMKVTALINDNITDDGEALITANMLKMISQAIHHSKRGSIHFDVELGIALDESLALAAGTSPSIGISDIETQTIPVYPDDAAVFIGALGVEHRIDCIDIDFQGLRFYQMR